MRTAEDVRNVVAGVARDKPIFVHDVAQVTDGGEEHTVRFLPQRS
jgi:multidrug efflux pump subunit AcrB